MAYGRLNQTIEVKVRNDCHGNRMVSRYVSPELANQMVTEGRAVRPGDTKVLDVYEDGRPIETTRLWRR